MSSICIGKNGVRYCFLGLAVLCAAIVAGDSFGDMQEINATETTLQPVAMQPLPLGAIRPSGWLENQLRIQADGLSGHLDEFWPDIKDSKWFGGDAEGWERAPYWLDGVIPLAFLLGDPVLTEKVTRYVEMILDRQHKDGWLGPKPARGERPDVWPLFLAMKMLAQFGDATGDARVPAAIEACLRKIDRHIDGNTLFSWAQFRWFEALIPIHWLYARTSDPWLLDIAVKLRGQGFDYLAFFDRWPAGAPTPKRRWNFMSHVVNNAMAVKSGALWYRHTGDACDRDAVYDMLDKLDRYHGMATGMFTGDECLAGKNPSHGTELCAVVEFMYSMEVLASVLGDTKFGDRLEMLAFNALPATFSPDMWSHQYDQQANQVECSVTRDRLWTTNGPEANIFGLEPNYGCCTSNLSQGWPKFAAHLWMQTPDGGLAAVAYAPNVVTTDVDSVHVTVELETEYPFRDNLLFTVTVEEPVRFPLHLRIPAWAAEPVIETSWDETIHPDPAGYHRIDREWAETAEIRMTLPMVPHAERRYNDAVAIRRGPLVYSLRIGEEWKQINEDKPFRKLPHGDWEVYPTTPWNYALALSEDKVTDDITFSEHPVGTRPFSPDGAPVSATVKARRVPEWKTVNGSAAEPPVSPVESAQPLEEVILIPYGCTNLRVTEFPTLRTSGEL